MKSVGLFVSRLASMAVCSAITLLLCAMMSNAEPSKPPAPQGKQVAANNSTVGTSQKLVVYYLHGTYRCQSCTMIESLTKEAVETGFADLIKSGRVEMKVVNVEEKGNEHLVKDYKLYTKSVILSNLKNGKEESWKNLDQVWTLLGNQKAFIEYIQKEVRAAL